MCTRERLSRLQSQGHSYFNPCPMLNLSFLAFNQPLEKKAFLELLVIVGTYACYCTSEIIASKCVLNGAVFIYVEKE